ncbi:MAG: hypothetical protein HQM13_17345 [SAR324 cluster bacterium]|nr:hypothetical protein [SAR324 cluster bacterium]
MSSFCKIAESSIFKVSAVFLVLLLFNMEAAPNLHYGVENAVEASFLWSDEGRQIKILENIQNTQSLKLSQSAYTAFYIHLSYLFAWLVEGGTPISPKSFAYGSKWVSLLSMNLYLMLGFVLVYRILSSFLWATFALVLLSGQSLNLLFATRIHPEATMILFVVLTLYSATFFFLYAKPNDWWKTTGSAALAIGTKPLVVFLIPWAAVVFAVTVWKHRIYNLKRNLWYILGGSLLFLVVFTISSPYQVLHLQEWLEGLLSEKAYSAGKWAGRSGWGWITVVVGDSFLGPVFSFFFCFSILTSVLHLHRGLKEKGPSFLKNPAESFFLINLSWVIIGNGYIVLGSRSFIDRYLIHTHFSFFMIIILGLYWWVPSLTKRKSRWMITIGVLLFFAGIHGQWRLVERDKNRRRAINQELSKHRKFAAVLPSIVPQEAKILYSRQIYIFPQNFPFAERVGEFIDVPIIEKQGIEYLIVNLKGRPGMKQIGIVPLTEREFRVQKSIQFWQSLEKNGVDGLFSVVRHFPEIEVTVYRKKMPSPI